MFVGIGQNLDIADVNTHLHPTTYGWGYCKGRLHVNVRGKAVKTTPIQVDSGDWVLLKCDLHARRLS